MFLKIEINRFYKEKQARQGKQVIFADGVHEVRRGKKYAV